MTAVRRLAAALAIGALALPAVAQRVTAQPLVCRQGGVEMIVGGAGGASCSKGVAPGEARVDASPALHRVTHELQRTRDDERRHILLDELKREEDSLQRARRTGDAADMARAQQNLLALHRELGRLPLPGP
jgi:hypothetical protein